MPRASQCGNSEYGKVLNKAGFSRCESYTAYWICHNIPWQSSEYILSSKYVKILNMERFWICKNYSVLNMPQYDWICMNRLWICLNMSEFSIIVRVLNMYQAIHSGMSLYKLMSTYWEIMYSELCHRSKMEHFGKIIIVFNYFCKKLYLKSFRAFCICVGF